MTYTLNELYNETVQKKELRFVPDHSQTKSIDGLAGAPLLAVGTMMAFNTTNNFWEPWTNAGAAGTGDCRGFLMVETQTHATLEVLAVIMVAGTLHRDDVPLNGESQANVDAELKICKARGPFYVQGLAEVR